MSYVAGHQHTLSQLTLISSPLALNFAMCVGCSINPKHEAFKYAKNYIKRPIISVGAIINSQPVIYSMPLNDKGEWTGTI